MLKDDFNISIKNLTQRKLRSWLTMIGIFIGIAAVIALIGLGEGLRSAVMTQFDFLGTDIITIQASGLQYGPPGSGVVTPLDKNYLTKIEKLNGVEGAYNRWIETTTIEFNSISTQAFIASTPVGEQRKMFEIMLNLEYSEGRGLRDTDTYKIVVGSNYAKEEVAGDENRFGKKAAIGDRIYINDKKFEIVGIMEKKGNFMLDGGALINENILLELFGDDDSTDIIAVKVRNEKEIDNVKEDIEKLLRKERGVKVGEEDFTAESAQKMIETFDSTLGAINIFVVIIASISLLVGGIGIMNTMYTSVLERTKDIGIMKAIGAKNSNIFTLFFIESGLLGMIGGVIGVILGIILAYGFAFVGRLALGVDLIQAKVPLSWIIFALFFSFILGTLFGVMPAVKAAKLQPVDALRGKK